MPNNRQPQPDAPESNAGDDFHLLWAARRALTLLQPNTDLKGIRLEGPPPDEAKEVDPDGEQLLGIDLAEYFGGSRFEDAAVVAHSQLKYSTRRSRIAWTAARLSQGKRRGHDGSIVHRLGGVYKAYVEHFGLEDVLAKLQLRLISNRPLDQHAASALESAKAALHNLPARTHSADLYQKLSGTAVTQLKRLESGAGIDSDGFCDFLRVLDLSQCGVLSRLDQDIALARELSAFGFPETRSQYSGLKTLLSRRMMPESRRTDSITADDIAAVLGLPRVEDLLPAPPRFEKVQDPVERPQVATIASHIVNAKQQVVCIHGGAGCGKTTLVQSLGQHLPPASQVVVFDCYGGGSYLDRAEVRHGYPRAIMQIANELASKAGSSLLLKRDLPVEDLLRELTRRLTLASLIVRGQNPNALVTVVIDAADNSLAGASALGDKSFVTGLSRVDMPEGCRLVLTARTHRVSDLSLPATAVRCEIQPFSLEETQANLRRYSLTASEAQLDEFHRLSNGVPRVQGYALAGPANTTDEALERLRPDGKTLEGIIDKQLKEADMRLGISDFSELVCPMMLALPRPIPMEFVAYLADKDAGVVRDFCLDMQPGMAVEGELVRFRDEDFESRLLQRFAPSPQHAQRLADILLEKRNSNSYAAAHVGDALRATGRGKELIKLVHAERQPAAILDPVERTEIFARRAQLALEVVQDEGDDTELLRLLFVVAEASKTDQAVEELLLKNADLACRYGNPLTVQRLYLSPANKRITWYGPTHLLCAANFSRNRETHNRAQEHLRSAEAWIRHWSSTPERERHGRSIGNKDIALGTEAVLRLGGIARAESWLFRWRPPEVVRDAAARLCRNLVALEGTAAFALLGDGLIRADGLLLIIDAAMDAGLCPPRDLVERAASTWCRLGSRGKRPDPVLVRPGIALCEAAALHKIGKPKLLSLLSIFVPKVPDHRASMYSGETSDAYDAFLRSRSLLSELEGEAFDGAYDKLLPQKLQDEPDSKDFEARRRWDEERKELSSLYGFLGPAYATRAKFVTGALTPETLGDKITSAINSGGWEWSSWRHKREPEASKLKALVLADAVVRACPQDKALYKQISDHFCKEGWLEMALALGEKAIQCESLHDISLRLVDSVVQHIADDPPPANELVDTLIRCSRVAGHADVKLGRHYFEKAVAAASEIDEEAFSLLQLLSSLITRAHADTPTANEPDLAKDFAKIVEDCHLRLGGWDRFPWMECVFGLTHLSPSVTAAALGRWEQQGTLRFSDEVAAFVAACLDMGRLPASVAVASNVLAPLDSIAALETSLSGLLAMRSNGPQFDRGLSLLADHAVRLAPLSGRKAQAEHIVTWADTNGVAEHAVIHELRSFLTALDRMNNDQGNHLHDPASNTGIPDPQPQQPMNVDWAAIVKPVRFIEPAEIDDACKAVETLIENGDPPWPQRISLPKEVLARIADSVVSGDYCDHLHALLSADPDLVTFDTLIDALQDRMRRWSHNPLVRDWRDALPSLLAKYRFHDLFWTGVFDSRRIDEIDRSLGVPKIRMCEAIIRVLPEHIRQVTAKAVHGLTSLLVPTLPSGCAMEVLRWAIPLLNSRVKRTTLACRDLDVSSTPPSGHGLAATILWFLFGHPDKRVRWLAVHAVRRIVQLGDYDIVLELSKWLDAGHGHPFALPGTTFYWLAARQWFFLLVDRLSAEVPESVLPLADKIATEATAPEVPHALIMMFAKRAALRLAKRKERPFNDQQVHTITSSLSPIKPKPRNRKTQQRHQRSGYRRASGERFRFDSIDTLPYWYNRVGDMFGLSSDDFCKAAERWICDQWGVVGDVWQDDPIRQWDNWDRDWTLRSHSHGSEPTIEDLHTYLEFNAMFCVAGELIATRPIVKERWERHPWEEWLSRWDLAWREEWRADRRQKTPLEPDLWHWTTAHREEWAKKPASMAFDTAVGLRRALLKGYIVGKARVQRSQYGDSEDIEVSSALVSAGTGQALLYALADSRHPYDYRIPCEGDELEIQESLADGTEFCLKGWMCSINADSECIDQHDPLKNGLGGMLIVPGTLMKKALNLRLDRDRRMSFQNDRSGRATTIFEHWNDCTPGERDSGFQTEGYRLWADRKQLLSFLRSGGWSLIVMCIINRRLQRHKRSSIEDKYGPQTKLYLIHSDGTVETASRRPGSRTEADVGDEAE